MPKIDLAWWVGEAINDRKSSVLAITAGLGSGKTHGFAQWHWRRCRENEGAKFSAFMEPTYQKIHDTAIPTYQKVLQAAGVVENENYRLLKSPYPKLVFIDQRPAHEVHFLSAETPDKIAGVEFSHAVEDEAGINCIEARRNLRGRLYRDASVKVAQFFLGGAPQGINAFAEEFDSQTLDGWDLSVDRDHTKTGTIEVEGKLLQVRKRRFIVWTDDNPFVTRQYLAELQDTYGHNPNLIRSYRYGEFCPLTEGAAYSNYLPQKHDIEDAEPDIYRDIAMMWDFNANPLAWVSVQAQTVEDWATRKTRYVAYHEANEGNSTLEDSCVEFATKHPPEKYGDTVIRLYGDRTGHAASHKVRGSDFEAIKRYLNALGFRNVIIEASKQVAPEGASVDALQRLFLLDLFVLCRRCRMLRRGLLATRWKEGVRKLDKPAGETHTHHPDAAKYWAWQEMRNFTGKPSKSAQGLHRQL